MTTKVTVESQWNGKPVKIAAKRVTGKSAFEIGFIVETKAKEIAPVNFGYLAGSITTQAFDHGTSPSTPIASATPKGKDPGPPPKMRIDAPTDPNEVLVGTPVFYGPYVEFGTVHMAAQPFLRPALDLARGRVLTVVQKNGRYEFKEYLR